MVKPKTAPLFDFLESDDDELLATEPAITPDIEEDEESDAGIWFDADDPALDANFALTSGAGVYTDEAVIDEAFKWFREQGFPYRHLPKFVMMQQINRLARTPPDALLNTSEAYAVADTFHPHRFHATCVGKVSPVEAFLDDVKFRNAIELMYGQHGTIPTNYFTQIGLSRGAQACWNFRPGFACYIYRRFAPQDAVVLDPSAGYGGRIVGWLAAQRGGRYVGIDPSRESHFGNAHLANTLGMGSRVNLIMSPIEDLDPFDYRDEMDFAFTSPPYFTKERYCHEPTQSWVRYGQSFDAWVAGFLRPMFLFMFVALKGGATAVVNIEDVQIQTKTYPLVEAAIESGRGVGFECCGSEFFTLVHHKRFGANQGAQEIARERVLIFKKP